jgi:hypothetical protein
VEKILARKALGSPPSPMAPQEDSMEATAPSKGKLVLGKLEELEELVYKVTNDQADMYILRTAEAIGDYVGVEYGWNMRILVNQGKEAKFTKPVGPTGAKLRGAIRRGLRSQ